MSTKVRQPKQERAILKKKKIIEAGYKLFAEVGYHTTNTAEIAKEAGVSTGIVYGYFKDKRDILFEVLDLYIERAYEPFFEYFDKFDLSKDIESIIPQVLDKAIEVHIKNSKIHDTLHSLTAIDEKINQKFITLENAMTFKIAEKFEDVGITIVNKYEKIHFIINLVQVFAHEYVYDKHSYIDYDKMKQIVADSIVFVIKENNQKD